MSSGIAAPVEDQAALQKALYSRDLMLISHFANLFVFVSASTLFLALTACGKYSKAAAAIHLTALFRAVSQALDLLMDVRQNLRPFSGYTPLVCSSLEVAASLALGIYLYLRCAPLIRSLTRQSPMLFWSTTIFFCLMVAGDAAVNGWSLIVGGRLSRDPQYGGELVWGGAGSGIKTLLALGMDDIVGILSSFIVIASLMQVYNLKGSRRIRFGTRLSHVVNAAEFRLVLVLIFGVLRSVFLAKFNNWGDVPNAGAYSTLTDSYLYCIYMLLLLIDSAITLLRKDSATKFDIDQGSDERVLSRASIRKAPISSPFTDTDKNDISFNTASTIFVDSPYVDLPLRPSSPAISSAHNSRFAVHPSASFTSYPRSPPVDSVTWSTISKKPSVKSAQLESPILSRHFSSDSSVRRSSLTLGPFFAGSGFAPNATAHSVAPPKDRELDIIRKELATAWQIPSDYETQLRPPPRTMRPTLMQGMDGLAVQATPDRTFVQTPVATLGGRSSGGSWS